MFSASPIFPPLHPLGLHLLTEHCQEIFDLVFPFLCLINNYNVLFRYNYLPVILFPTNSAIHIKVKCEKKFSEIIFHNHIYTIQGNHNVVYIVDGFY